jgi:glycosyltransferase involved in cell wall biosynthesis
MRTAVFSIISPNYRHFARVLMASVRREHPDWDRFVLFVGDDGSHATREDEELFTAVALETLPLPSARQFCFRYTILELNTAVKPWMFEHLFGRGYNRVVYFDPDIVVYSPLDELDDSFLTLTPHLTGSIGGGDDHPSERTISQAGAYNLGFLAVTRHGDLARFLAWWQAKLELQCVVEPERGIFVDQKWMDLAPGLFPDVRILRHDGYNVAYWNLRQRTVAGMTVNGAPLRFFHFSGFEPEAPDMVSKHDARLRTTETGDAAKLLADYAVALRATGHGTFRNARYAYATFRDGTPLPNAARIAYRNSPELQAAAGDDPFAHPELFRNVAAPVVRSRRAARLAVRSYQLFSRLRPIVLLFPKPMRTAVREFLLGRRDPAPRSERASSALPPGLNVVGYFSRDTGVGESARLCVNSCEAAGLPAHAIDVDATDPLARQPLHRASIYHVNADQILDVHAQLAPTFAASSYNIGCWHWELPELPDQWIASAAPLDEIWAPSAFIQSAISRKVSIPVVHMPHGIDVTNVDPCSPEELGVPGGRFTFLSMFDFSSVVERKNPRGAIDAFRRAFGDDDRVALLMKAGHSSMHPAEHAELVEFVRGMPNVTISDRMLPRAKVNGLLAACDAVVSLHRSEGFGLILAEAMAFGKPVVATGWSGNMDFMTASNSCPVAYELTTIARTMRNYEAGQQWAEPDVDDAAKWMRRLVDDAELRTRIGEHARTTMRTQFSAEAAGMRYRRRLALTTG